MLLSDWLDSPSSLLYNHLYVLEGGGGGVNSCPVSQKTSEKIFLLLFRFYIDNFWIYYSTCLYLLLNCGASLSHTKLLMYLDQNPSGCPSGINTKT